MCLCDIFKMPLPNGESTKYALCMIHFTLWYYFPVLRYTGTSLLLLNVGSVKVSGNHFMLQTLIQKKFMGVPDRICLGIWVDNSLLF